MNPALLFDQGDTCTENLGCPFGEVATCYFDSGSGHYKTKCYTPQDLDGIVVGDEISSDKTLVACGPCACFDEIVDVGASLKIGKSIKDLPLECPIRECPLDTAEGIKICVSKCGKEAVFIPDTESCDEGTIEANLEGPPGPPGPRGRQRLVVTFRSIAPSTNSPSFYDSCVAFF